ncbi:MAG TPA: DUF2877 domain-containing protein [Solirubrobacteraceae bacterium]|nr:DUF2877 domain-containing protein [Solirubrobacteraceae bacterium]
MIAAAAAGPAARALVVGRGARRALQEGAAGIVELTFGAGGYVRLGDDWILLAPARSPLGPLSVLVAGLARGHLVCGEPAVVADGALVAGGVRVDLALARDAAPARLVSLAPGWRRALAAALEIAAPAPAALAPGLDALCGGDQTGAVALLAGRGDGLTPVGDDVLAGYAAWAWAQGRPVTLPADRCAPLGRAYLRCAARGELPVPAAAVLQAIGAGDAQAAARRASRLGLWGATSGSALLWGMAAGATWC